jgi:hypothetical protein
MPLPECGVVKLDVQITDKGQMAVAAQLRIAGISASVTIPNDVQRMKSVVIGPQSRRFIAICRQRSAADCCLLSLRGYASDAEAACKSRD